MITEDNPTDRSLIHIFWRSSIQQFGSSDYGDHGAADWHVARYSDCTASANCDGTSWAHSHSADSAAKVCLSPQQRYQQADFWEQSCWMGQKHSVGTSCKSVQLLPVSYHVLPCLTIFPYGSSCLSRHAWPIDSHASSCILLTYDPSCCLWWLHVAAK